MAVARKPRFSLAHSSSVSSVEEEISLNEYTEDFHSSSHISESDLNERLLSNSFEDNVVNNVNDGDSCQVQGDINEFLRQKLVILEKNRQKCLAQTLETNPPNQMYQEVWLEKIKILKNIDNKEKKVSITDKSKEGRHRLKTRRKKSNPSIKEENTNNELGCFQTAFERIRFENLRSKSQEFINSDIHLPRKCEVCQQKRQALAECEFYKKCLRTLQQKHFQERYEKCIQSRTSAMLLGRIIEDGPKPGWTSEEIWKRIMSKDLNLES